MYDVIIIGAGPGGYTCAIRTAQLGGKVCVIEKNGLGGTCTQRGCIPTKYLHSIGDIIQRSTSAKKNGLDVKIEMHYNILKSRMMYAVAKLASGIKLLMESNGIHLIQGEARIISANKVMVNGQILESKHIVIATGSYPICLPGYTFGENILSTNTVLELEKLPKSIVVIGGGYAGCEFSAILNVLGCKVSLIEAQENLMPAQTKEIGITIEKYMRLDGINVITGGKVQKITNYAVIVDGKTIEAEKILVCVGRRPNIDKEELERIGVKFNDRGILVDENMRTTAQNIYAIGDVTGAFELAHVASKQGEVAAQNIMDIETNMDYTTVPACVFTYPEVAFVGDLKGKSGEFPLAASAKANCLDQTRGIFKVFAKDGIIVGAFIIAPHAGEIIGEIALAIKMEMKIEDVFSTIHVHPTLPESYVDALRDINGEAIHLPPKMPSTNE